VCGVLAGMNRRKPARNGNSNTAKRIGKAMRPPPKAKKKHSVLLCPNSKGGAIIRATAWRTVATNTVMMNRLMGEAA